MRTVGSTDFVEPDHTIEGCIRDSLRLLKPLPSPLGQELLEQVLRNQIVILRWLEYGSPLTTDYVATLAPHDK